ncbi:hypothetical protein [Hyphomicrobium sp. 99]|uniref:hypothetical protein n=1 Tax=Hyphomicrobium sp. 99 TaxID=1163419 RepID=UPI0005F77984|nr:hypothetical protein [Hyphomicrobium sp. 99]
MSELERLTIAKNAAANGRALCVLLFAACIAVYLIEHNALYVKLAVLSALPFAVSYVAEATQSRLGAFVSLFISTFCVAIVTLHLLAV